MCAGGEKLRSGKTTLPNIADRTYPATATARRLDDAGGGDGGSEEEVLEEYVSKNSGGLPSLALWS